MIALAELGGPYATVFDVGGFVGEFARACHARWPDATIVSFEPNPDSARRNTIASKERWHVVSVAIGSFDGDATLHVNLDQPSASSLLDLGSTREAAFGIGDRFQTRRVPVVRLDRFEAEPPLLVKVDVEGAELDVLLGAAETLKRAMAVVVECQVDPDIFVGSPAIRDVDELLRSHGLRLASVVGAVLSPSSGRVLQADLLWRR